MYLGAPYTFNKTSLLLIKKNVCGNMLEAETYIQCQCKMKNQIIIITMVQGNLDTKYNTPFPNINAPSIF